MKKGCDIGGEHLAILQPCMSPLPSASCKDKERPSAQIRNKYGEIRSPYRMPRVGVTLPIIEPLTRMLYSTEVTHNITSSVQCGV